MFFSIANSQATAVRLIEAPWELPEPNYAQFEGEKSKFRGWCKKHSTDHHFLSMVEGMTPTVRVSSGENGNPPFKAHGFIVDYDGKQPNDPALFVIENMQCEFAPTHLVRTFSRHSRVVWMFEKPLVLLNADHYRQLMLLISKKMKLNAWMPGGIETKSIGDAAHYYEQGIWQPIRPDSRIPTANLEFWSIEAVGKMRAEQRCAETKHHIPLHAVHEEVEARFPGKWTNGTFEAGDRGTPFWSPTARNEPSAVVFENGMYCFSETAGAGFFSWERIFGAAWMEQFEVDRMKAFVDNTAFDGRNFWRRTPDNLWHTICKSDLTQELKLSGFDGRIPKGGTYSEIDKVEVQIKTSKRVSAALPFLFHDEGIIPYRGRKFLNVCTTRPIDPAPPCTDVDPTWAEGRKLFPFIYRLMTTLFYEDALSEDAYENDEEEEPGNDNDIGRVQLERLLAWLKYFYENSYNRKPKPGHVIVLAGPVGKGKSLLCDLILGGLMSGRLDGSGAADGSGYLSAGERWTGRILESPIIKVDDDLRKDDPREAVRFTARLKKCVANASMVYEEKYRDSAEIPWFGRPVILCNADAESLRILPNMDLSVRDKISLFRASDGPSMRFGSRESTAEAIRRDLPHFARFLIDWEIPDHCKGSETRFGVKPFHHPELLNESLQSGLEGIVLELVARLMESLAEHDAEKYSGDWRGSYTALHGQLSQVPGNEGIMRDIRPQALAVSLGNLSRNGYGIYKKRGQGGTSHWVIRKDLLTIRSNREDDLVGEENIDTEEMA